ncbi:MAG: hypothetical protein BJ554DRAFT_3336, partial [Olpidium bornovanus]
LAGDDVIHHTTGVADLEATGLDPSDCRRTDDQYALGFGGGDDLPGSPLGDSLGNDGDGPDLVAVSQHLHRRFVDGPARGEVDDAVDLRELGKSIVDGGEHREKRLLGAPVELLDVGTSKRINHGGDRGRFALANKVKIQHSLHRPRLHPVDERTGVLGERGVPRVSLGEAVLGREVGHRAVRFAGGAAVRDRGAVGSRRAVRHWGKLRFRDYVQRSIGLGLRKRGESKGHDGRHVGLGAKDVDGNPHRLPELAHQRQAFLVVRSAATHVDLDVVRLEGALVLLQGAHDALESRGNVREVRDSSADQQDLAVGVRSRRPRHQVEDGLCVLVRLRLGGSPGILAVVRQLVSVAERGDRVTVHDAGAAAGNHGPDAPVLVQHGELEARSRLGVQAGDVRLLLRQVPTERRGELHRRSDVDHGSAGTRCGRPRVDAVGGLERGGKTTSDCPFRSGLELRRLVELRSQVEVHVNVVEPLDEIGQGALLPNVRNGPKQTGTQLLVRGERPGDGDGDPVSLCVDVADVDAALVREKNCVLVALGVDAHVVLRVGPVRHKRLDDESL